jgi:hypothetical protein
MALIVLFGVQDVVECISRSHIVWGDMDSLAGQVSCNSIMSYH